jgi:hypothetical protein
MQPQKKLSIFLKEMMLKNTVNVFFFLFATTIVQAQKLHHQMITSQGVNSKLTNGMLVNQSIGQQSAIGNFTTSKGIVGQGYIQSMLVAAKTSTIVSTISAVTYPNPFVDELHFKFSSQVNELVKVTLFDTRGRLIFFQEKTPVQDVLTLTDLYFSEGTYFVKLETNNFVYSTQIIKTR